MYTNFKWKTLATKIRCLGDLPIGRRDYKLQGNGVLASVGIQLMEVRVKILAGSTFPFLIVLQSLSCVQQFATPWTAACQTPLSSTSSWSLLKFMSIESVMLSNHFILCHPLLLLPSNFPSTRVFSNELALCIRWPKYWNFSLGSVLPMNIQGWFPLEWTGLILQPKGLTTVFSSITICKCWFLCLYDPTLASLHDCWKNHSFDNMDFCQQSDVSAF